MKWTSYTKGILAEYLAALLLLCKGYVIQERRYKTIWGEIDLIVKRGQTLVFVEVKKRRYFCQGLEAVTTMQRGRIEKAGQAYLASVKINFKTVRFDVIVATPRWLYHLQDAWRTI